MPHVNVWIRKNDYETWQRIKDKPGFISASIRTFTLEDGLDIANVVLKGAKEHRVPKKYLGVLEAIPQVQAIEFCKHGADPTLCKYRKNGKPCK